MKIKIFLFQRLSSFRKLDLALTLINLVFNKTEKKYLKE